MVSKDGCLKILLWKIREGWRSKTKWGMGNRLGSLEQVAELEENCKETVVFETEESSGVTSLKNTI